LTESARVEDLQAADLYIQHLRRRGVPVCLDDFGAGAASFNYLGAMAVDVVKIDGAAIENTIGTLRGRAFMKAMGSFCSALNVQTVGEMIDTREKADFLKDCKIDFAQGYLYGKGEPVPSETVAPVAVRLS
jgi:EAL domain-containing protein (putative c-di-GMP-specific phosphodiesterase class I)